MMYNLKEKSLYKVFSDYDQKLCRELFNALKKKEDFSYRLLEKKYGPKLDGKNASISVSYMDNSRVQNIIVRLNTWFVYADYLYNEKKESLDYIYTFFTKTKDEKLVAILSSYQKNKNQVVNSSVDVKEEICVIPNTQTSLVVNSEKLTEKYDKDILINVKKHKKTKCVESKKDKEKTIKKVKNNSPDDTIDKRKRKEKFIEYLYTEEMTLNEKEEIKKKFIELLPYLKRKNKKGYELCEKLYGDNLDNALSDYHVTLSEKSLFHSFLATVKKYLDIDIVEKNTNKKIVNLKYYFLDYFYTENMNIREKQQVLINLKKAMILNSDTISYQIFKKIYNEDYTLNDNIEVTKNDKIVIKRFTTTLMNDMNSDLDKLLQNKSKAINAKYFFEYFYTYDMTNEEKEETKNQILNIVEYLRPRSITGYEIAKLLYDENLCGERKNIRLSDEQKSKFNNFKSIIRKYFGRELTSNDNKYIYYSRRPSNFFEYFYKYNNTEEDKLEVAVRVKEILEIEKNNKMEGYALAQILYGENLDNELQCVKLTKKENTLFRNFVERIKSILDGKRKASPILCKKTRSKKENFFEYFYEENMTEEEKMIVNEKIVQFILEHQNYVGLTIVYKIYGQNLDEFNDVKLTSKESSNLSSFRREIRLYLNNAKVKIQRRPSTFFEYFYEDDMTEKEKKIINKKILDFVSRNLDLKGIKVLHNLYGEKLNKLTDIKLTQKEKSNLSWVKNEIRLHLFDNKIKNTKKGKKRPSTFFEYFYEEGMTNSEKARIKKSILKIIEEKKGEKYYCSLVAIYGDSYDKIQDNYSRSDSVNCKYFINYIKNQLLKSNHKVMSKSEKNIENCSVELECQTPQKFSAAYLDSLILKLHNDSFIEKEIKEILNISEDYIVNFYIRNLHLVDLEHVLDYILNNHSNRIKEVLESDYFLPFREQLSEKEQEIVYLKLLSKVNKNLTDEVISKITELPLDKIVEYKIITNNDTFNSLNEYIKTHFIKKEYKKIKDLTKI